MLPILFTLKTPWGAQPIYSYGVLLGVSLIVGYPLVVRTAARLDRSREELIGNAYLITALCGVIGSRLLYVLENRELLQESGGAWFDITSGGVTAYGGFLGGLIGAAIYLRSKRESLAAFADACMPAAALGTVLTRIGCYLYGCDFGTPLSESAPGWLKALGTFPRWEHDDLRVYGSPAWLHHIDRYGLLRDSKASMPVHPTQLYEALAGLVLLGLALLLARRRAFAGQVALIVAMSYGTWRFLIEYLRDDPERAYAFQLSWAQLISLLLVPVCAVVYSVLRGRARRAAREVLGSAAAR
jgi:phosphatidylglycerol:prolipoprotein diacylglycerol transferase